MRWTLGYEIRGWMETSASGRLHGILPGYATELETPQCGISADSGLRLSRSRRQRNGSQRHLLFERGRQPSARTQPSAYSSASSIAVWASLSSLAPAMYHLSATFSLSLQARIRPISQGRQTAMSTVVVRARLQVCQTRNWECTIVARCV